MSLAFRWVFLAYLVGISGFGRAFAHLHVNVAGLPLFSGEMTIALLAVLGAAGLWRTRAREVRLEGALVAVSVFLAVGCVYALVGLSRGFGIAALRDFALVYYATFFLFTLLFLRSGGNPALIVVAVVAGAGAGAAWRVARVLVAPELTWGHAAPGHQAIVAWVAVLIVAACGARPATRRARAAGLLAVACCSAVVFLSAQRSLLAVIGAVAAGATCLLAVQRRAPVRRVLAAALTGLALWLGTTVSLSAHGQLVEAHVPTHGTVSLAEALKVVAARWADLGPAGAGLLGRWRAASAPTDLTSAADGSRAVPALSEPDEGATARSLDFRLMAWRGALSRIASSPLLGIGFGPSPNLFPDRYCMLITSPTSNCGNAHNTYLTLAMRMGIPVLAAFLLANLVAGARALRAFSNSRDPGIESLLVFSLAALLSLGVYAGLGLFLESPYLSSLYWVVLGLMHEATRQVNEAGRIRRASAQAA